MGESEQLKLKYLLQTELEKLMHENIMAEITLAGKLGVGEWTGRRDRKK